MAGASPQVTADPLISYLTAKDGGEFGLWVLKGVSSDLCPLCSVFIHERENVENLR
ncbi:hypothetical protein BT69DRAFT_1284408 [Atractiella rhizophila]|nr:hypothetical protein BT69DRAFT_1284408 [Atractiella rhizophila]